MLDEEESREALKAQERLQKRRRVDDVQQQMSTQQGRRFVWALLISTRFEGQQPLFDTHGGRQSYWIGKFDIGRALSDEIRRLCPEQYLLMLRENTSQTDEANQ